MFATSVGTPAQIGALSRCVHSIVGSVRRASVAISLAGLAACFVDPPPVDNESDSEDPCAVDGTACACMTTGCEDSSSATASVGEASTQVEPDTSASTDASTSSESTGDGTSAASESTTEGSESGTTSPMVDDTGTTGVESCDALECGDCVSCVDGEDQACASAYGACDAVDGCVMAVACLVNCALGIDCFEECCADLDPAELEVVNDLITCKSDECVAPCSTMAEFEMCP